ncbi:hypothetical protein LX32DRAFT_685960 [Colletotrichum zoysiae]|uniref:Uncharacterized protein n=1 Tax=Colletotrichum zoysiae TaxID=1216348 RepID=A0AAD9H9J1_9PEZI|nr:hypothetical protein LX32DRAFT_685960 [Colletotrichum zoysiae]
MAGRTLKDKDRQVGGGQAGRRRTAAGKTAGSGLMGGGCQRWERWKWPPARFLPRPSSLLFPRGIPVCGSRELGTSYLPWSPSLLSTLARKEHTPRSPGPCGARNSGSPTDGPAERFPRTLIVAPRQDRLRLPTAHVKREVCEETPGGTTMFGMGGEDEYKGDDETTIKKKKSRDKDKFVDDGEENEYIQTMHSDDVYLSEQFMACVVETDVSWLRLRFPVRAQHEAHLISLGQERRHGAPKGLLSVMAACREKADPERDREATIVEEAWEKHT